MNEELKRWIRESNKPIESIKENKDNVIIKPSGKCQICGRNTAEHICLKCQKFVCKSCYFKIIGICKKCVSSTASDRWDGSCSDWKK